MTNDNFKKMVLLYNIINADIPVIIIGETGCGKKSLIIKLNLLLNNGINKLEIINIYPGITDEYLSKKMKEINQKAKNQKNDMPFHSHESPSPQRGTGTDRGCPAVCRDAPPFSGVCAGHILCLHLKALRRRLS